MKTVTIPSQFWLFTVTGHPKRELPLHSDSILSFNNRKISHNEYGLILKV